MMDKRTRALGVPLAALALLLGACSDDSSNDAATGTTAARAEPSAQGDLTIFCDSAIESETMFEYGPESEGDAPPTDEAIAAFASELRPILEEMESSAPDEVADDAKTFAGGIRASLEAGDYEAGMTEDVLAAGAALDTFVFDNCEMAAQVDVVAREYSFEGLPDSLPAGRVGIRFDNQGTEVHEAAFLRIVDGENRPIEELLALPEEEAQQLAQPVGGIEAGPGEQRAAVLDLQPGRYAVLCFVPVGMTSTDQEPSEDAPPHAFEGMVAEVVVG